ncbi:thioesterase family protein [Streptomyces sp. NBC_01463]|uniref:acyl-CoA thioesterase n=1 Tax=unclassified Streptomyces TaxID=2593676 RepID=UPI00255760F8|nr:acyl-CoA thioesterase domain-containing protein [Streptomyces sp. RTGN2]WSU63130.1 thioesterase family protein [Streptomyces sp. NBC_01104]
MSALYSDRPDTEEHGAETSRRTPPPLGFEQVLELTDAGDGALRGRPHAGRPPRAFGGVTLAQALRAGGLDVGPDRQLHSLHAYFLRAVNPEREVTYRVRALRDGSSYAARQVDARQGTEVLHLTASFKRPETTPGRQARMPGAPGPDECEDPYALWAEEHPESHAAAVIPRVVSLRTVPADEQERTAVSTGLARRRTWLRAAHPMSDDPLLHAAALAYLSDLTLSPTAALPWEPLGSRRSRPSGVMLASLDHAMWFHRPCRADAWLLYAQHSTAISDGRVLSRGEIWSAEGDLVATVQQEALIRIRPAQR